MGQMIRSCYFVPGRGGKINSNIGKKLRSSEAAKSAGKLERERASEGVGSGLFRFPSVLPGTNALRAIISFQGSCLHSFSPLYRARRSGSLDFFEPSSS